VVNEIVQPLLIPDPIRLVLGPSKYTIVLV